KEWRARGSVPFSEDCLYLNIWTPAAGQVDKKLPVAMWIHGGGFREGFAFEPEMDGGEEWATHGVILVSVTYRLGVLGFLSHPLLSAESPHGVSGNYGLLDQIAALKWIRNNIRQFGGDPYNITVFGQSAGAGSVQALCASILAPVSSEQFSVLISYGSSHKTGGSGGRETGTLEFP
ncbi:partial Fumonisin B1 esterase, partial [uncultured bacterium]